MSIRLLFFLCLLSGEFASASDRGVCPSELVSTVYYPADADVKFVPPDAVYWRDQRVKLPLRHVRLVRMLLENINEPIDYDRLYLTYRQIPADDPSPDERLRRHHNMRIQFNLIKIRFRKIDPTFSRIQVKKGEYRIWRSHVVRGPQEIDGAFISPELREVFWKGQRVALTKGQFQLVYLLLENINRPVSNAALRQVFSDKLELDWAAKKIVHEQFLRTQLFFIRSAFRAVDPGFNRIESWKGAARVWRHSRVTANP